MVAVVTMVGRHWCSGWERRVRKKATGGGECEYAGEEFVFHTK
jgi:hypothetical protein